MPASHIVQGTQLGGGAFEQPVAVAENAAVGPGGRDFANEQIVGLLVVRLGDQAAFQPGGATGHQGQIMAGSGEQLYARLGQFGWLLQSAYRAQLHRQRCLRHGRQLQGKAPAALYQCAGASSFI